MLFFRSMYLHLALFMTCRCFSACLSCTIASTSCLFWDLRILPSQIFHLHPTFSMTCGCSSVKLCILNLFFQRFADTPIKIVHPQRALSITCRYSPLKFCIFNLRKSTIADISTKIISTTPTKQSLAL